MGWVFCYLVERVRSLGGGVGFSERRRDGGRCRHYLVLRFSPKDDGFLSMEEERVGLFQ